MSLVAPVRSVLDRLSDGDRSVDVWWRDDDAVRDGAALDRLFSLSGEAGCPLALAVIPAAIEEGLVNRLAGEGSTAILVHGFRHANHAREGEKKSEFGPSRPLADCLDEIRRGRALCRDAFGGRALDVFVPPWNRAAPGVIEGLRQLGFRAVSAFGHPSPSWAGPFCRIDAHLDPVSWRHGAGLASPEHLAQALARAIAAGSGAIGLLTHHLVFDDELWDFCADVLEMAGRHPAVRFRSLRDLLSDDEPSSQVARDELRRPVADLA